MTWHYEVGGQQRGPVAETEIRELIRTGTINRNSLVWREGMPDWQPVAAAFPDMVPPETATLTTAPCVECGRVYPTDELVTLNNARVCAQCKPIYLQRMAEGVAFSGGTGLWREGKKLVTRSETPFPDRCVKCNEPANGFRLKRVLYWQHPAFYLLLLCNLLVLIIVLLIVRKKAVLHVGLCEAHRRQRRMALTTCAAGLFGGLGLIIAGIATGKYWLALPGLVVFFGGAIWGVVKGRVIVATKIENGNVWVGGVGRDFLNQLPERR